MKFIDAFAVKNPVYIPTRKIEVKGIVVHSVGCAQSSGANAAAYFNKDVGGCVHGFLEANGDFYMTMPIADEKKYAIKGGHAGGSINNTHLGIELMETTHIKYKTQFTFDILDFEKAEKDIVDTYWQGVKLFAYLCNWYELDPLKDGVILSHWESYLRGVGNNHRDPEHIWEIFGLSMDKFRKDIDIELKCQNGFFKKIPLEENKRGKIRLSKLLPRREIK